MIVLYCFSGAGHILVPLLGPDDDDKELRSRFRVSPLGPAAAPAQFNLHNGTYSTLKTALGLNRSGHHQ